MTVTQRKTLKVARPTSRPATKFGVKKPTASAPAPAASGEGAGDIPDVADIPDMPAAAAAAPQAKECPPDRIPDVGKAERVLGLLVQIAACGVMGFLVWRLVEVAQTPLFTGGAGIQF